MNDRLVSSEPVPHFASDIPATVLAGGSLRLHRFRQSIGTVPSVRATLSYLPSSVDRPFNYAYGPPAGTPWENYQREEHPVSIADARHAAAGLTVHGEGFALWDAPSAVRDFMDSEEIVRCYHREVAEIACAATGATRAYVFDHLVRKQPPGGAALDFGRSARGGPPSANGQVHNDYTERSVRRRLGLVLGEQAAARGVSRYSIVNVWRSIGGPVLDAPLAVCDARTINAADLVSAEMHYPKRVGEVYLGLHNPHHRWFYFSAMHRSEALVFKQYDSQVSGVARFTLHAAFRHPDAPAGAPPRESIEARCLVVYE
jgi:hypothetical protein